MTNFSLNSYRGFSMISLLIASALGVFITAAAGRVFISSKASFNLRTAVSAVNENGRYGLSDIRRTVAMTGRAISAGQPAFAPISASGIVDGGNDATVSDIIAINYAAGNSCAGPITGFSTVRIKLVNDILTCELNGVEVPMVSGVHLLRVLYGVMDNPMTSSSANRYITAEAVQSEANWANVVSMRVGLIVSSDTSAIPRHMRDASVVDIDLLGMTFTPPNTEHLYRAVTTTVVMRNLNPIISRQ